MENNIHQVYHQASMQSCFLLYEYIQGLQLQNLRRNEERITLECEIQQLKLMVELPQSYKKILNSVIDQLKEKLTQLQTSKSQIQKMFYQKCSEFTQQTILFQNNKTQLEKSKIAINSLENQINQIRLTKNKQILKVSEKNNLYSKENINQNQQLVNYIKLSFNKQFQQKSKVYIQKVRAQHKKETQNLKAIYNEKISKLQYQLQNHLVKQDHLKQKTNLKNKKYQNATSKLSLTSENERHCKQRFNQNSIQNQSIKYNYQQQKQIKSNLMSQELKIKVRQNKQLISQLEKITQERNQLQRKNIQLNSNVKKIQQVLEKQKQQLKKYKLSSKNLMIENKLQKQQIQKNKKYLLQKQQQIYEIKNIPFNLLLQKLKPQQKILKKNDIIEYVNVINDLKQLLEKSLNQLFKLQQITKVSNQQLLTVQESNKKLRQQLLRGINTVNNQIELNKQIRNLKSQLIKMKMKNNNRVSLEKSFSTKHNLNKSVISNSNNCNSYCSVGKSKIKFQTNSQLLEDYNTSEITHKTTQKSIVKFIESKQQIFNQQTQQKIKYSGEKIQNEQVSKLTHSSVKPKNFNSKRYCQSQPFNQLKQKIKYMVKNQEDAVQMSYYG